MTDLEPNDSRPLPLPALRESQETYEDLLVWSLLQRPDLLDGQLDRIRPDLFTDDLRRALAMDAAEQIRKTGTCSPRLVAEGAVADGRFTKRQVEEYLQRLDSEWPAESLSRFWVDDAVAVLVNRVHTLALDGALCKAQHQLQSPNASAAEVAVDLKRVISGMRPQEIGGSAVLVCLADVQPQPVEWLWPGRIPLGKLTLIAGDPNLGKSFMTLDMAARVSSGTPWPDASDTPNTCGQVVILSAEDDVADTIRPRLDAAGADVQRVHVLTTIRRPDGTFAPFSLERDVPALEQAITARQDVRLLIIDPISAYCGRTDSHRNSDVRGLLAPLATLAAKHRLAVLAVTHLNKSGGVKALYRATGSLAFTAAARGAWLVAKDQHNPLRRLWLPVKMNLAPDPTGMAYTLEPCSDNPEVACVAWEPDPIHVSADDALAAELGGDKHSELDECVEWLRGALVDGPLLAAEVKQQADQCGFTKATLRRARKKLSIQPYREGFGPGGKWYWALSGHREAADSIDAIGAQPSEMSTYGEIEHLCSDEVVEWTL